IVDGPTRNLTGRIVHDDRKSIESWVSSQGGYMRKELMKIFSQKPRLRDRLRRLPPVMPLAVFFYCLFIKGLVFNGRAGLFYALQRLLAESTLSLMVLERSIRGDAEERDVNEKSAQLITRE